MAVQFKGFCIWTAILTFFLAGIAFGYPFLIDEKLYASIDQLMSVFPSSLLKAFNMDIASISKASGWIKTEGTVFYALVGALYASILGGSILLKEESDKTIEFLYALPVSRAKIVLSRFFAGAIYASLLPVIVSGATCLVLWLTDDLVLSEMLPLLLSQGLVFLCAFSISFALSTLFARSRGMTAVSFALVFGSYILYVLGQLSAKAASLRYASLFAIVEARAIVLGGAIPLRSYLVAGAITLISLLFALLVYQKKDLV